MMEKGVVWKEINDHRQLAFWQVPEDATNDAPCRGLLVIEGKPRQS